MKHLQSCKYINEDWYMGVKAAREKSNITTMGIVAAMCMANNWAIAARSGITIKNRTVL